MASRCELGEEQNRFAQVRRYARLRPFYHLDDLVVDFAAVAQQPHRQHFLLSVGPLNGPIVTNAQLEQTRERCGEGFGP